MVGAGIIAAFETAIFGKWVDVQIATTKVLGLSSLVAWVGFASTTLFGITWVVARVIMNNPLPAKDKLDWKISAVFIFVYLVMALSWLTAAWN